MSIFFREVDTDDYLAMRTLRGDYQMNTIFALHRFNLKNQNEIESKTKQKY
jgi:hypothetical protein